MRTIFQLFGRSPFSPLQEHMKQVLSCVKALRPLFETLDRLKLDSTYNSPQSYKIPHELERAIKSISELEHLADLTKHDLRTKLSRSLYLPVDRSCLMEVLSFQDMIADACEKIAHMLGFFPLKIHDNWREDFFQLLDATVTLFEQALEVIHEFDELLMSSFGGSEAWRVDALIEEIAIGQSKCRDQEKAFLRKLYQSWQDIPYPAFVLWDRVIESMGKISLFTEKTVYRVRRMLDQH